MATKKKDSGTFTKRANVEKGNVVLDKLEIIYVPIDSIIPNAYNPNKQSTHDFELLCRSITENGCTQPIIVQKATHEIVDGEHRWRACSKLGFEEVPVVYTTMSPEQMRIATLRHNRARGEENAELAADVLRYLVEGGFLEEAKNSLMLDDIDVKRLTEDLQTTELEDFSADITPEMLGPSGSGLSAVDTASGRIDTTADNTRAKEQLLATAKATEETSFKRADDGVFRLVLFFVGEEANVVREVLCSSSEGHAAMVFELCREAQDAAE